LAFALLGLVVMMVRAIGWEKRSKTHRLHKGVANQENDSGDFRTGCRLRYNRRQRLIVGVEMLEHTNCAGRDGEKGKTFG